MSLDFSDAEKAALITLLKNTIAAARFRLSPRIPAGWRATARSALRRAIASRPRRRPVRWGRVGHRPGRFGPEL